MAGPTTLIISILYLTCGVFIFLLGLTILHVGRDSAPTRATALMLFFAGIGPLLTASGLFIESAPREGSVLHRSMVESFEYLWEFFFPSLMLFAMSFPRENTVLRRYPVLALVLFFPYIFHLVIMMTGDRILDLAIHFDRALPQRGEMILGRDVPFGSVNNITGAAFRLLARAHRHLFALVNIAYSTIALVLLWRNRRDLVNPRIERQMRTVGIGLLISVVCYSLTKLSMMFRVKGLSESVSLGLVNLSLVASGGSIAYAVIRQQFLGIRHVIRRVILYTAIAVLFAALYVIVVRPVSDFFGQYSSISRRAFETGFVVITIIAFQPVLKRLEGVLERVLLKGRADASLRFRGLGDTVAGVTTLDELDGALRRGLRDAIDASDVRLVLAGGVPDPAPLIPVLSEIGEPIRRRDIDRIRERNAAAPRSRGGVSARARSDAEERLRTAIEGAGPALLAGANGRAYEVFVPLYRGRTCTGFMGVEERIYSVPYSAEEMGYLAVLGTQVGTALHNIELLRENVQQKLLEEELRIARKIQMQLLPQEPPKLDGFDICAVTVPSRYVGGDYYDHIVIDGRWLAVVVADVSGKGIPASILTATLQATVRSNPDAQTDPARMLGRLNRLLYSNTSAAEFATLFYAVVDLTTGRVQYANAGHEFPFVASGGVVGALESSGIVLGCLEDFVYESSVTAIPAGGMLVVFTDGVSESESNSGEYFGTEGVRRVLSRAHQGSARDICRHIIEEVRAFGGAERQDDITLLVIKRDA